MATPTSSSKDGAPSVVTTGVLKEKRSFTWIIEDFELVRMSDQLISGQKFQFEAGDAIGLATTWEFQLDHFEVGEKEPKTKWISIHLRLLKTLKGVEQVTAGFSVDCKRADGTKYVSRGQDSPPQIFNIAGKARWGWSQFIQRDTILKDLPVVNGSLTVNAEFTLYAVKPPLFTLHITTEEKGFETKAIQKLIVDLGKSLALTGSNVDSVTKLVSKDNVEFPVNRGILSARSVVFQFMFQSGLVDGETGTGVVRMDDLSGKTLTVLLHYLTTGTLHPDWRCTEVILELPYAAQKFGLELLFDFLDKVLGSVCTVDNAKQLVGLAKKLGMKKAEMDLLAFIVKETMGK